MFNKTPIAPIAPTNPFTLEQTLNPGHHFEPYSLNSEPQFESLNSKPLLRQIKLGGFELGLRVWVEGFELGFRIWVQGFELGFRVWVQGLELG